ncbi:MAG: hypothetical protein LH650_07830, partial [Chloroflexi bacterium]|nr:hypothetical protein [Chloroflexota bacterium]
MATDRPRIRLPGVALAALMAASSAIGGGYSAGTAQTPGPSIGAAFDLVDLRLPDAADLDSDASLPVVDEPEPVGDVSMDDVL